MAIFLYLHLNSEHMKQHFYKTHSTGNTPFYSEPTTCQLFYCVNLD